MHTYSHIWVICCNNDKNITGPRDPIYVCKKSFYIQTVTYLTFSIYTFAPNELYL